MRITDAARSSVYSNRRFALALKIRETARRSVLHRLSLDFTFPLCFIEHRSDNRRRALDFLLRIRIRIRVRSRSSTAPHRDEREPSSFLSNTFFCPPRVTAVRFQSTKIYRRGKGTTPLLRSFEQPIHRARRSSTNSSLPVHASFARIFRSARHSSGQRSCFRLSLFRSFYLSKFLSIHRFSVRPFPCMR